MPPSHTRAANDSNKENAMDVDVPNEGGEEAVPTTKIEDGIEHEDFDPNQDKEEKCKASTCHARWTTQPCT